VSSWSAELPLVGAGGEKVDLWRTFVSHGLADLPPMRVDEDARSFETTLVPDGARPRTVRVSPGRPGYADVRVVGRAPAAKSIEPLLAAVRHVLRLDEDLSGFYRLAAADPELEWAADGAGRMVRSPTVFEDVVKTICTTNCAWSATERMVRALVTHLGEPAPGAPSSGPYGRAFPAPKAMAEAGDVFYRDVVRAGYRGRYLQELAASVAGGTVELEELAHATPDSLPDDEVYARLLALPGIGPYAAAQIMMLLGRYSRLILDSWTRPKYARLRGRRASDATIARRFRRYGRYAGLAFWLYVTRDWVEEPHALAAQTR
jgi:3-methyladenine DNA glycosylase/8-oxoguanine DNA glycosylase